jgi:hypothetical protein
MPEAERGLRAFENVVQKRIFEAKRERRSMRFGNNCIMRSFVNCAFHQILLV